MSLDWRNDENKNGFIRNNQPLKIAPSLEHGVEPSLGHSLGHSLESHSNTYFSAEHIPTMAKKSVQKIALSGLKLATSVAIHYGPAGIVAGLLKVVTRKPLRWLILMIMQPILSALLVRIAALLPWEKHETPAK